MATPDRPSGERPRHLLSPVLFPVGVVAVFAALLHALDVFLSGGVRPLLGHRHPIWVALFGCGWRLVRDELQTLLKRLEVSARHGHSDVWLHPLAEERLRLVVG